MAEKNGLETRLESIEKKLGGQSSMPVGVKDPLSWHLEYIESLIGSSSKGNKLYLHKLEDNTNYHGNISFINSISTHIDKKGTDLLNILQFSFPICYNPRTLNYTGSDQLQLIDMITGDSIPGGFDSSNYKDIFIEL